MNPLRGQETLIGRARRAGERLYDFHGGLRLRHHKKVSCEVPVERLPLPDRLYVPLLQHTGREAEPAVAEGQYVLKGQPIGCFQHLGSGCVHAPTSGTVIGVVLHPISHPLQRDGYCVVIEPDGLDRWTDLDPLPDWGNADPEGLMQRIRDAGIVGLGGAVFPTGYKVREASKKGIHTLILNGSECEPWISCDEMLMREQPDAIVLGARILQRAVGAKQTLIAIEDPMDAVSAALEAAVSRAGSESIRVVKVKPVYPEGGERQLIQVLTGLEVPSGGRPADLGLLCQNVATASAVARAVTEGKPLIERIVTVTGNGVNRPRNVLAAIGTPIADLVEHCGGYTPDAARLVLGGPMMGIALKNDANPVTKAANCVLVLSEDEIRDDHPEMPCIRCGECARVCPSMLLPQELNRFIRAEAWDEAGSIGLIDCIECGCCDHVCPSHIPLAGWFRFGKSTLRERRAEQERSDRARNRYEAREERVQRKQLERKRRIAEKKAALADRDAQKSRVAEAVERARKRKEESS